MANIPTIPGTAQVQDQQIGVKRDPSARIRALGSFRQTVGQADQAVQAGLGVVADYEMRKRKAEETAFFTKSSVVMLNTFTDGLHTLKKQPDDQIVPNWVQRTQATKDTIKNDADFAKMSPAAQRKLLLQIDSWAGESTATMQKQADLLGSDRRAKTAIQAKKAYAKTGDDAYKKNALAALDAQNKAGDLSDDAYKDEVASLDSDFERNKILNGIDADPYATLKDINAGKFKDVSEQELGTLRNQAEKQVAFVQRSTASDLINDFQMTNQPKDKAELQQLVKTGKVTGEFVKNYGAMVEHRDHEQAVNNQALILNKLRDMDLSNSDNPEKDVRKIIDEAASLPPALQKEIHAVADSRIKAAQKGQATEIHAQQLEEMRAAHEQSMGRILITPASDTEPARRAESVESIERMDDEKFFANFGDNVTRAQVLKTAKEFEASEKLRYANAQKAFINWTKTKKGAEATPQQAADERERLGFGRYSSTADVAASFKAGKIDVGTAKEILHRQFGVP